MFGFSLGAFKRSVNRLAIKTCYTNSAREVDKIICIKIAMQKLSLSNRAICVAKLDSMKFNNFVPCVVQH